MAEVRSQDKRDKLRLLYAGKGASTLLAVLMAALTTCDAAVGDGQFVQSTAEAGGSVAFQILSEYSPVVARRLIGELLDLYDVSVNTLTGTPSDAAIYELMMRSLVPIRQYQKDYSGLRYGAGLEGA